MKLAIGKANQKTEFPSSVGAKHSGDYKIEKTLIYLPECFAQTPRIIPNPGYTNSVGRCTEWSA
jgi:hypothetical protein